MGINGHIQEESCGNFHEFYGILYNLICREWGIYGNMHNDLYMCHGHGQKLDFIGISWDA